MKLGTEKQEPSTGDAERAIWRGLGERYRSVKTKRCPKCRRDLALTTENFGLHKRDGWQVRCKRCRSLDRKHAVAVAEDESSLESNSGSELTEGWKESENRAELTKLVSKPIKTLEELVKVCDIDTEAWAIDRYECTAWTTTMKVRRKGRDDEVRKEQNYRVSAKLTRRVPKKLEGVADILMGRMMKFSPSFAPSPKLPKVDRPHMLVANLSDCHWGKRAWAPETGEDFDLKIVDQIYRYCVDDLIAKSSAFPIEKILFPIGNDFFTIDNPQYTTTAGTPQDVDGRYAKIFSVGQMAVIWAIDKLMKIAPVEVLWVPGNHDRSLSFGLLQTISAWYRNCDRVSVDNSPKVRKYVHYHKTLLGFSHGHREKHGSLPAIMAGEVPAMWAAATTREFILGHFHQERATHYRSADSVDGVVVRISSSISAADLYHFESGFVNNRRAADGFIYGRDEGLVAHVTSSVPAHLGGK